jgi:phage shock protein C
LALHRTLLDFRPRDANLRNTINEQEESMAESDELEKLGDLHRRGILSDDEFSRAKARVLNGSAAAQGQAPIVRAINGLRRSRDDRWLGGVCGGIGQSTGIAAWLWRLAFSALALCAGTGILVYLLMWIFVPLDSPRAEVAHSVG